MASGEDSATVGDEKAAIIDKGGVFEMKTTLLHPLFIAPWTILLYKRDKLTYLQFDGWWDQSMSLPAETKSQTRLALGRAKLSCLSSVRSSAFAKVEVIDGTIEFDGPPPEDLVWTRYNNENCYQPYGHIRFKDKLPERFRPDKEVQCVIHTNFIQHQHLGTIHISPDGSLCMKAQNGGYFWANGYSNGYNDRQYGFHDVRVTYLARQDDDTNDKLTTLEKIVLEQRKIIEALTRRVQLLEEPGS